MESVIVLMSTYNGVPYLEEQLDSILTQKGVIVKLVIRDDGSPDGGGTVNVLKKFQSLYHNSISIIYGKNIGFAKSFTELIKIGLQLYPDEHFFAFADQDDVWLPDKLCRAINYLKENKAIRADIPIAYCSNTQYVDENLKPLRLGWDKKEVRITKHRALIQSFATGCTMVFNRKAAELYVSHIPKDLKVHDFFMYQLCVFLGRVLWDAESHILYRQHSRNQIGKPDFTGRMLRRFRSGNYKNHTLENQNRNFLYALNDCLSTEDKAIIESFCNYRISILNRLKLLFNQKISYTIFESDFFYRLKIIRGGYNCLYNRCLWSRFRCRTVRASLQL